MKRKFIYHILTGLLLFSFSSCKKFLDQDPQYMLTPEGAVVDENSAQSILNGAYSFTGKDEYTVRFTGGFSSMLGSVNASSSAYNFNMTATGDNQYLWAIFHKTVNGANAAIEAIGSLPEDVFITPGRKEEMLGEAYAIRSFANCYQLWYFARWWDDPSSEYGIIYKDKASTLTNVYSPRLTVGESYAKIIEDLDYAIAHAPDYSTGVRVSKQFAQGLKAKLLLYRGTGTDYHDALALVTDVIDKADGLGLKLEPSLTSLYSNSWDSKELLFCRYREQTDNVVSAYNYTYGYNYATLTITALGEQFLQGDPRYNEAWGDVRSPVTGNNTYKRAPTKLCRKGRQEGGDNDKYTSYFMRLTELYFMKAELLEKTGAPLAEAMEYINRIRRRSGLTDVSVADKNEFYSVLFKELFIELHLENDADFMAAVRFKDPVTGDRLLYSLRNTITIDENRLIYPLPTPEMKYNPFIRQNPSYEHLVY